MTDNKPTHEDELKACPFCGHIPKYSYSQTFENHSYGCANVMCSFNPSDNRHNNTKQEAIEHWNTRTSTPPAPQAEGEVGDAVKHVRTGMDLKAFPPQAYKALETLITAAEEAGRLREELEEVLKSHDEEQDMAVKAEEEVKELRLELAKSKEQGK